jgi:acyl-coenzyme A thioesterase PaaI-like protein
MSSLDSQQLDINGNCFACGQKNPYGLRMKVTYDGDLAVCRLRLTDHFQGWAEIAHGGIVCALLDEVMAYAVIRFLGQGVTIDMEAKFRMPVPLGQELLVSGRVTAHQGRRAETRAELRLAADNALLAQGKARWLLKLDESGNPIK